MAPVVIGFSVKIFNINGIDDVFHKMCSYFKKILIGYGLGLFQNFWHIFLNDSNILFSFNFLTFYDNKQKYTEITE